MFTNTPRWSKPFQFENRRPTSTARLFPKPFLIWKTASKTSGRHFPTHGISSGGLTYTVHHGLETDVQVKLYILTIFIRSRALARALILCRGSSSSKLSVQSLSHYYCCARLRMLSTFCALFQTCPRHSCNGADLRKGRGHRLFSDRM